MPVSAKPISLLHITDPHILPSAKETLLGIDTAYYLDAVLKHSISSCTYDLCIITGDLVQTPCPDAYHHLLRILERYNLPFYCLPGNHDDFDVMQNILCTNQVNCTPNKNLGTWQLICLNTAITGEAGGYLPASELAFLQRCLHDKPNLFTVIAMHHHCIPTQSAWMDTMMIKNADDLLNLISRHKNAKLLINGHIHQEIERNEGSLQILTTPSTCFQFKPFSKDFSLDNLSPGYRQIKLYADGSFKSKVFRIPEPLIGLRPETQGY